jgi:hypothetical protein
MGKNECSVFCLCLLCTVLKEIKIYISGHDVNYFFSRMTRSLISIQKIHVYTVPILPGRLR